MANEKAKRAGLYARVSTADQRAEMQLHELRQLAEQRGWSIVGEYVDEGVSGGRERRPELDRLMADAHRGRLDVVACWRFDRFARSVRHLVTALDDFRAIGVDFVSVRDSVDTSTAAGRMVFTVIAAMAEFERELIRERTIAGVAAARRRGKRIGRRPRDVDVDRALELRAQGASVRAVAAELGLPRSVVHRALSTPSDGRCAVCGAAVVTDLHGRARWHLANGAVCEGMSAAVIRGTTATGGRTPALERSRSGSLDDGCDNEDGSRDRTPERSGLARSWRAPPA